MRSEAEVARIVLAEPIVYRRRRLLLGLLAEEAHLPPREFTVVGGSAGQQYTEGRIPSDDIDLLVSDRAKVAAILRSWGFVDHGKMISRKDWGVFIDLMSGSYEGSERLTREVATPYATIRLSAIEDLILGRIREVRVIPGQYRGKAHIEMAKRAYAQAIVLIREHYDDIDWAEIDWHARRERLDDLVADARRRARDPRWSAPENLRLE